MTAQDMGQFDMAKGIRLAAFTTFAILTGMTPALAQGRETLGIGRVFTNDWIGDGSDRWRTGSYSFSIIRGEQWQGQLSPRVGDVVEYRFRGEIVAPGNLTNPNPADRLYAGVLSAGAHLHFDWSGFDVSAGADLVMIGEQTGLDSLQSNIHDVLSLSDLNVGNFQVDDGFFLHGTLEIARDIYFAGGAIRPFVELQAGVENMARAGVDVTLGSFGEGGLRVRDVVSGQRVAGVDGLDQSGFSFLFGGDVAYVDSSELLPSDRGYEVEDVRYRLRLGANYDTGASNIFYGLTYLSEEFVGQPEGQVVGSLTLGWAF
jgi:hypothetical protein